MPHSTPVKRPKKASDIRGNRMSAVLGTLAGWIMKGLALTLRFDLRDQSGVSRPEAAVPPVIFILWHNRFFCVPPAWRRLCGTTRRTVALTSASKDGDMVARAVAALVGLKRALLDGADVCLTPDGPRGPRYQVQPGFVKLAQATGAPIVPIHLQFSSAWRLKTWDRFVIPKPFSRVAVVFGERVPIPRDLDDAAFEAARLRIESLLVNGTDDA